MKTIQAELTVKRKEYLSPHYIRVFLTGEKVPLFANTTIGVNNKILIPPKGSDQVHFPEFDYINQYKFNEKLIVKDSHYLNNFYENVLKKLTIIFNKLHKDKGELEPDVYELYLKDDGNLIKHGIALVQTIKVSHELVSFLELLSLPNEVRREIKVTGLILERMKPVNFDPESPKSRMEYAQIVLAFAEENLKNPSNDLLKMYKA